MPELDGIRGLAILGVLCSHGAGLTGIFGRLPFSHADALLSSVMVPLWGGVDLFFTLSGFLITGILLRTKNSENYFSSFYGRRMLRIFPIYYLVLILSLTAGHFSSAIANYLPPTTTWKVAYFAYLQNWPVFWHGAKVMGGVWGAYWSLAVEEQFYLVWPIIVLLSSEKAIASICYIGLALALPLRFFLYYHYFGDNFGLVQITSSRVDGLFIGAACAVFMFRHKRPVPLRWIVGSAIGGVIILGYIALFHRGELVATGKWMTTVGISGFALISGALVALSQHRIPFLQRVLTFNLLRTAGKYSYGIYVYHLFSFLLIRRYLESKVGLSIHLNFPERILLLLVAFVIVFLAAKLSYDLFESRFLALKRYFNPAQATGSLKM
jgi:peptidoglycan/LPS O-acetylase OafA/YrhL